MPFPRFFPTILPLLALLAWGGFGCAERLHSGANEPAAAQTGGDTDAVETNGTAPDLGFADSDVDHRGNTGQDPTDGAPGSPTDAYAPPRMDDALSAAPWFDQVKADDASDADRFMGVDNDQWLGLPDRRMGALQPAPVGPPLSPWFLRALNGARLTFRVESTVGTDGFSPVLMVYGPQRPDGLFGDAIAVAMPELDATTGMQVARIPRLDVTRPGVFLVLVGDRSHAKTGSYVISTGCAGVCRDVACPRVVLTDYCAGSRVRDAQGCITTACATGGNNEPPIPTPGADEDVLDVEGGYDMAESSTVEGDGENSAPAGENPTQEGASDTALEEAAPGDYGACGCEQYPPDPVCGADGISYPNPCFARCRAVAVVSRGPCPPGGGDPQAPGQRPCATDADCPAGDRCEAGVCASGLHAGEARCDRCGVAWAPVCGMDGLSYTNRCRAECRGVAVAHDGECGTVDACGCAQRAEDDPVCDAAGRTWRNPCEAHCAGVARFEAGPCATSRDPLIPCADDRACPAGYVCRAASDTDRSRGDRVCVPDDANLLPPGAETGCVVTGCLGEICAEGPRRSPECAWEPTAACVSADPSRCRRNANGVCTWQVTREEVAACLGNPCTQDLECGRGRLCVRGVCMADPCACDGPDCATLCAPRR